MKHSLMPLAFIVLFHLLGLQSALAQCDSTTTVILSLDGFRWDYPEKAETPNLKLIQSEGVKAVSLIPCFPSKTFPNHYSIATGLVPDHHGLVNNSFYDRSLGRPYAILNKQARFDPAFYEGEPIWVTARKQGVRTASFFWVGSDVPIQGVQPDYWKNYNGGIPFNQRTDTIIKWLSLPSHTRPRLIMAYYHEPDAIGHEYGPDDPNTLTMIHHLDSLTGILYNRIRQLDNGNCINFIVLSDHGMGAITSERNIALRDYIPESWDVRFEGGNPNFNIYATPQLIDTVYSVLNKIPHLSVWKPSEVPEHLYYGSNQRTGDIIVVADSAWSVTLNHPKKAFTGGTHGYDIKNTDIHAIFYASGPDFKENYVHPSFQNIHIYSLIVHLLGITPAKTDGNLEEVIDMLK